MNEMKENDFEKLETLLQTKSYKELTSQELQNVSQWVNSEQEYEALRVSGQQVASWFTSNPVIMSNDELLRELKKGLQVQHLQNVSDAQLRPIWGYALSALIFGVLGWWIGQSKPVAEPITKIEQVLLRDTVYLTAKPDTVFQEQIIYRDRPVVLTTQNHLPENKNEKGVSMKEKEELDNLLVSGSE
ncbi:MAG: hypothetical protein KIT62_14415 [Cyclobacteriaceae bacterium]|nr:hypothetical protein [Cyclobacteriaceae bacterium]